MRRAMAEIPIDRGDELGLMLRDDPREAFEPIAPRSQRRIALGIERAALDVQQARERIHGCSVEGR